MDKERAIQCVPVELMERLKRLASKLWDDKNPASVHLNAILEEFEPDVKSLSRIVEEYETDYSGRLAFKQGEYDQKEARVRAEMEELKVKMAGVESARLSALKQLDDFRRALAEREREMSERENALMSRESAMAGLRAKSTETEGDLNTKYVTKMQELYDKVNKKELTMLSRWEEKNKLLETRIQELEAEYATRGKQLQLREKALESEFNARKAELLKTFDRIREGLEAREKAIAERELKGGGV